MKNLIFLIIASFMMLSCEKTIQQNVKNGLMKN